MTGVVPVFAVDVIGWAGAGALLLAYALVTRDPAASAARRYLLLNLAGSAGLAANGVVHGAWPSAGLNLLWLVIALAALGRSRAPHGRSACTRTPPVRPHPD